jgi:hypothetical protein
MSASSSGNQRLRQEAQLDRLAGDRERPGDHGLRGDHGRERGKQDHRHPSLPGISRKKGFSIDSGQSRIDAAPRKRVQAISWRGAKIRAPQDIRWPHHARAVSPRADHR